MMGHKTGFVAQEINNVGADMSGPQLVEDSTLLWCNNADCQHSGEPREFEVTTGNASG